MKILLISNYYKDEDIASKRIKNFIEYFCKENKLILVTENYSKNKNDNKANIVSIDNFKIFKLLEALRIKRKEVINNDNNKKYTSKRISSSNIIYQTIRDYIWIVIVIIKTFHLIKDSDIIFCSAPSSGIAIYAIFAKVIFRKNVVLEFRDRLIDEEFPKYINRIFKLIEAKTLNCLDICIFVSDDILKKIKGEYKNNKAYILKITNSYNDRYIEKINDSNILNIGYIGSLYNGKRSFKILFEAIKNGINDGLFLKEDIIIKYAGKDSNELLKQIDNYKNYINIKDYGFCEHKAAISIENSCDILVSLTWNTYKEQGIITGKIFEYIETKKPIIGITYGDIPESEMTKIIKRYSLGIAVESFNFKEDVRELEYYIYKKVNFKKNHIKNDNPYSKKIEDYYYKNVYKILQNEMKLLKILK